MMTNRMMRSCWIHYLLNNRNITGNSYRLTSNGTISIGVSLFSAYMREVRIASNTNFFPKLLAVWKLFCNFALMSKESMIQNIQRYFATQPVTKAYLFGSYSRGEETPESDVDLLVTYDKNAKVTLFTIGGMYMDLKELLGREVDLVEEGTLLPYAVESANKDKVLIYERKA